MKKIIIDFFFAILLLVGINEKEKILISDEAIRFMVIAKSDSEYCTNA